MLNINKTDLVRHHKPETLSDRIALGLTRLGTGGADILFGRRYGDRVITMETVAAMPAMVAATQLHLKCLRRMIDDRGWVRTFMDEAERQRMHLMSFAALSRPRGWERFLIVFSQVIFYNGYFLLYLISPRTAHRLAGYASEQAVTGYSRYLERIEADGQASQPASEAAIAYWNLTPDACVRDMVIAIREDEAIHRDIQHSFADALAQGQIFPAPPGQII